MNMACRMDPYPCRTCWDNKLKILKYQKAGLSDQAILDQFAKEQGKGYRRYSARNARFAFDVFSRVSRTDSGCLDHPQI